MNLLEKILKCTNDEEVNKLIFKSITEMDKNSTKIGQLVFLDNGNFNSLFKGFIPLHTRIKYNNRAMETYGMETTDYFYEFARFIRKYNIHTKAEIIYNLAIFINNYFGYPKNNDIRSIFLQSLVWKKDRSDEENFDALDNLKIGDLKGVGVAMCTERAALAQQILSLFGFEVYYCLGCIDNDNHQETHCFNIVKRKNDHALLDYSMPVTAYSNNRISNYYPFIGKITTEEFIDFVKNDTLKTFLDYDIFNNYQQIVNGNTRTYVIGKLEIEKMDKAIKI